MLSNTLSQEDKKKLFIALREGKVTDLVPDGKAVKVNTTYKNISYETMINAVKDTGIELLTTYMNFIYDYYPGNREAIKEKFKSILYASGTLEYSTSTGYDSVDNIDKFKKKLHCIRILNEGYPDEIYKDIQKELAYVIDTKVLSGGQAKKLLEEVLPEYSQVAIEYLQQNLLGTDGRSVVNKENSIGAKALESGAQLQKGDNTASDKAALSSEYQAYSTGITTNNYSTNVDTTFSGRGGDGDTLHSNVTNTITNSGGAPISDDRAAIFYQLGGIMSYWDIQQLVNDTKKHLHQELHACTSNANDDTKKKVEKLHTYMEDFSHCDLGMENDNINANGDIEKSAAKENDEAENLQANQRVAATEDKVTHIENDGEVPLEITEENLHRIARVMATVMEYISSKNPIEAFDILYKGQALDNCDPNVKNVIRGAGVGQDYARLLPILKELGANYKTSQDFYYDLKTKFALDRYIDEAEAEIFFDQQADGKEFVYKPVGDD